MAGGTVEGAVVSGGAQETTVGPQATGPGQPSAGQRPSGGHEEPEAFDLGAASQEAVIKRVGPVLVGLGLLAFLIWLIRRKR